MNSKPARESMSFKRVNLGRDGHGQRVLPSLASNLALIDQADQAAPYMRHIGLAAPFLAASVPDLLPGLLLPSIASPKPPAARKAPTRVNLFKASRTLSTTDGCGGCPVFNGTIIVTHYGYVPPQTFLCYTMKCGSCEILVPYDRVLYQDDPARQFTYAANAASSISLEITSFAANNPLNGQATSAHVMDIDDICTYSSGTFELRSTTPKDAVSSTSLAGGLVGIMGPESFSETLLHPYHCGTKTYPGWSLSIQAPLDKNDVATVLFSEFTEHRWFVNTTFQVHATVCFQMEESTDFKFPGNIRLYIATVKGSCPPPSLDCKKGFNEWASTESNWRLMGTNQTPECAPAPTTIEVVTREGDNLVSKEAKLTKHDLYRQHRQSQVDKRNKIRCPDKEPCEKTCSIETVSDLCTVDKVGLVCCKKDTVSSDNCPIPDWFPIHTMTVDGTYTTCELENAYAIAIDVETCQPVKDIKPISVQFEIRTLSHDPQQQFGPATITRLEGLTKDIVIQLNIRSAVAGIQTGEARSVAPPTGPSMLGLGEEDAILVQAQFDSPSTQIARVMTTATYKNAAEAIGSMPRQDATTMMEAAPLGDTIRNIAGTISKIGHSIGGPLGTIGDVVNTVGGIAGTIGDAIGSIFSAPSRKRRAIDINTGMDVDDIPVGTMYAAPSPFYFQVVSGRAGKPRRESAAIRAPSAGKEYATPESVMKSVRMNKSYTNNLSNLYGQHIPIEYDSCQAFPWVLPDSQVAGVSMVYVTDQPMTLPERNRPKYFKYIYDTRVFYIDEYLVDKNEPKYIKEAAVALAMSNRDIVFLTTDASNFIYGDSFSLAVVAAILCPSLLTAVSGGISLQLSGTLAAMPVGLITDKLKATVANNLILIAPVEQPTTDLRSNTAGTEVVSLSDVLGASLESTPALITILSVPELFLAQTFVSASAKTPIGLEETREKERAIEQSRQIGAQKQAIREEHNIEGLAMDELQPIISRTHDIDVPGFGPMPVPLQDITWWQDRDPSLSTPPSEKGMGISMERIQRLITTGDIPRLKGIAMGILSREMSAARKREGGRPKKKASTSRLPQFKRPKQSQISSLIDRLKRPADEQMESAPLGKRPRVTSE